MPGKAKELRLGLVCYGGSSLAIYMHGITKEIHRLVRASALRAEGITPGTASEQCYAALLDRLSQPTAPDKPDAPDLRVIVDVISGTSAGGINGVYLGKALAGNLPLDALRNLWFDRADMNQLVIGPRSVGPTIPIRVNAGPVHIDWRIRPLPISWKAKVPLLAWRARKRSPLRGNDMSHWLFGALNEMEDEGSTPPSVPALLPPGHPLDLFVTITDFYGYDRDIPLAYPTFVTDVRHRHALDFHFKSPSTNDFSDNPGLAFAARTTSCFPGVFPPVRPDEFSAVIGAPLTALTGRCFRIYTLSNANPNDTYFIDGGVLDNKPFGWAIDTIIRKRPAESEVDRRLLYIEPDPAARADEQGGDSPETLEAVIGALSKIPRDEPILDDLLGVQAHNEKVERIRDVIEANFARVAGQVRSINQLEDVLRNVPPEQWPWRDWNDEVHELSMAEVGAAYATYVRLKISSVLDGLAGSICSVCNYPDESNQAFLVRETVRAWARTAGLFAGIERDTDGKPCRENGQEGETPPPFRPNPRQTDFLQSFDLGYMRRRLRFLVAALNWWYRCVDQPSFPVRADLDKAKATIYQTVGTLDALADLQLGDDVDESVRQEAQTVRERTTSIFSENQLSGFLENGPDGALYASQRNGEITDLVNLAQDFLRKRLESFASALLGELINQTAGWDWRRVRDLVVRYLGFPIWDVLLYPVQALSQIGEGDDIKVLRVSPLEAKLLTIPDGGKVQGVRRAHFYAFFSREARENDYLWGRLDAAEELIRLLFQATGNADATDELVGACQQGFTAVLDEEADALTTIQGEVNALRDEVEGLGGPPGV